MIGLRVCVQVNGPIIAVSGGGGLKWKRQFTSSHWAWLTCAQNANGYQGPNAKQLQQNVGVACFSPENREAT